MTFRTHYLSLSIAQRDELAASVGTKRGLFHQMVYGAKRIELGLADCLVARCPELTLDDMPLTDRARQQRVVRRCAKLTEHTIDA